MIRDAETICAGTTAKNRYLQKDAYGKRTGTEVRLKVSLHHGE